MHIQCKILVCLVYGGHVIIEKDAGFLIEPLTVGDGEAHQDDEWTIAELARRMDEERVLSQPEILRA